MKVATVTEFRTRTRELLDEVERDQGILVLSRPKNKECVVILTLSHYEALEETAHLIIYSSEYQSPDGKHRPAQGWARKIRNPDSPLCSIALAFQ